MKQNYNSRLLAQAFVGVFALLLMIGILAAAWLLLSGFIPECGQAGCAEPTATAKVAHTPTIIGTIIINAPIIPSATPVSAENAHTEPTPTSPPMSADDAAMFTATAEWSKGGAYPGPGTVEAYP